MKEYSFCGHDLNFVRRVKKMGHLSVCMPVMIEFNNKISNLKQRFFNYLQNESKKEKSVLQLRLTHRMKYYYDSEIDAKNYFVDTNETDMLKIFSVLSNQLQTRNVSLLFHISENEESMYTALYHPFIDGLSFLNLFLGFFNRAAPVEKLPFTYVPLVTDVMNTFHVVGNIKHYADSLSRKTNLQYTPNIVQDGTNFSYMTTKFSLKKIKALKNHYKTPFSLMIISLITYAIFQTVTVDKLNIRYIIAVKETTTRVFNKLTCIDIILKRTENFETYVKHVQKTFHKFKDFAVLAYSVLNIHNKNFLVDDYTIDVQFSGFPLFYERVPEVDIKSIYTFSPYSPTCIHVCFLSDTEFVFLSFSFHTKDIDKKKLSDSLKQIEQVL